MSLSVVRTPTPLKAFEVREAQPTQKEQKGISPERSSIGRISLGHLEGHLGRRPGSRASVGQVLAEASMSRAFGEGVKSARGETAIPRSKHVWNIPSYNLLQINYCTRNSRNYAIVLPPLRAIASHELLHELLRQQTTIAATPLAESTPSPNTQMSARPTD